MASSTMMVRAVCLLLFTFPLASSGLGWGKNTKPEQIHLALAGRDDTGAATGMRVAWFTQDKPSAHSTVKYGLKSGLLTTKVIASNEPVQYLGGLLGGYGYHHVVAVIDLPPSTQHYYAVGSDEGGWSEEWSFKTAPTGRDAAKAEITVSIFGDMGWLDSEQRPLQISGHGLEKKWDATMTRNRLEELKPKLDMVWNLGDIGYADDAGWHNVLRFQYEEAYNGYMNWMQNLSATMPFMVLPGNHESECHSPLCVISSVLPSSTGHALKNFTAYNNRWHMPSAESVAPDRTHSMWYSFDYGPVHFVSINTETDWVGAEEEHEGDSHIRWPLSHKPLFPAGHFDDDGAYLRWLEADLKAASEAKAKARNGGAGPLWIVAGGHRPHGDTKSSHVPLFEKYGVDLYLAGHSHSYARSTPVNNITYIVVGGAGCDEMPYPDYGPDANDVCVPAGSPKSCDADYMVPAGAEAYKTGRMASGVLKATASELNWELIDSRTGSVLDHVTITQQGTGATPMIASKASKETTII